MSTQTSSQSLPRSVLTDSSIDTVTGGEPSGAPYGPVSPLPFLVSSLYDQHEDLLRFLPGAFRRQGDVLGQGASFSVEKHTLKEIGRGMVENLVHGDDLCARWSAVAIKRLRNKHHIPWKTFETIERELIALKLMRGAPNSVQLVGLGWETAPVGDDLRLWPVLVLEYAECGSLAKLQDTVDPLSYEVKRKLCADVACGLLGLHNSGLLHGDVKSENILIFGKLDDQHLAKLSDFGYAGIDYHLQQDLGCDEKIQREQSQVLPGATELWSAPEYGKPGTRRALMDQDVYSWGLLVLRTMVDGRNPFLMHQNWSEQQGNLVYFVSVVRLT
jgi:serine/threonine protein kinase